MASLKEGDLLLLLVVLSLAGAALAAYLTYATYNPDILGWCTADGFWDCGEVTRSAHSRILGVPVALVGLLGFAAILLMSLLRLVKYDWSLTDRFPLLILLLAGAGSAFSAYLTLIELFVLHAVCFLCLTSFFLILATLGVSYWHYRIASPA